MRSVGGLHADRRLGYKLSEVAKCLARDPATVISLVSRYSERMAEDEQIEDASGEGSWLLLE
jgi:hypothetical protein